MGREIFSKFLLEALLKGDEDEGAFVHARMRERERRGLQDNLAVGIVKSLNQINIYGTVFVVKSLRSGIKRRLMRASQFALNSLRSEK